jgi:serine/threonine protein kinase
MDYCQDKSLNNYINKLSSIMSIKIKIFLLYQVTVGLRYLRDSGIVHLDMKPENLLVKMASMSSNNLAIIKIIDFGEAYGEYLISKRGMFLLKFRFS